MHTDALTFGTIARIISTFGTVLDAEAKKQPHHENRTYLRELRTAVSFGISCCQPLVQCPFGNYGVQSAPEITGLLSQL
jgi:hypothetical protein